MSRTGWIFSAILHGAIIALAAFGLPQLFKKDAPVLESEPIVVGLVEIAEQASQPDAKPEPPAPKPAPKPEEKPLPEPPQPKPEEKAPEPTPPEPAPAPEPVVKAPEPPPQPPEPPKPPEPKPEEPKPPEPKPEVAPAPEPEPEPEPTPEPPPEPPPPEPTPEPPPEPQPVVPKPPPPKPKPPSPDLNSLLKNLAKEEPAPPAKDAEKTEKKPQLSDLLDTIARAPDEAKPAEEQRAEKPPAALSGLLATTIGGAIKRKVEERWNVPAGITGAESLLVALTLDLAPDGSVLKVQIADRARYNSDTAFRAMAESAMRAVLQASPFEVLRDHGDTYEQWRVITMTFRPPV